MASLQASLLAKLNATSAAAKKAAARKEEEKRRAAAQVEEREKQARLQKLREEGEKTLSRNVSHRLRSQSGVRKRAPSGPSRRGRGGGGSRRRSGWSKRRDDSDSDSDDDGVKDDLAKTSRREVLRRNRGGAIGVARRRRAEGPPKPLPGMDFVVRKTKNKKIRVPHTSDYSDMFGEKFLRGIDLKVLQDNAKESAIATKEAQEILSENKLKNQKAREVARKHYEEEKVLEREGKLTTKVKNSRRCEASALDWEVVDTPVASNAKRPAEVNGRPVSTTSEPARKLGQSSKAGSSSASVPNKSDTAARKRALQERLQLMMPAEKTESRKTPPTSAGKRGRVQRQSDSDASSEENDYAARKRRKSLEVASKRRSVEKDTRDADRRGSKRRSVEREEDKRVMRSGRRRRDDGEEDETPRRKRRRSYVSDDEEDDRRYTRRAREPARGDISDEWSDEEDDDDGSDDGSIRFNDLDEYEEEEEESRRMGELEDKKEFIAEKRRKSIKEKRKRQLDSDSE